MKTPLPFVRKINSLFVVFFLMTIIACAQRGGIKGTISDSTGKQLISKVSVGVFDASDKKFIRAAMTDEKGEFMVRGLAEKSYVITFSFVGLKPLSYTVEVKKEVVDLGKIYMSRTANDLSSITVISKGAATSQKDDTIQYNANQYKVNPDATTEDLIRKMPGITIDKNGNITAQGEQVKKVTVDGKDFFGDDATAAIKNLPANVIDKVQVFDRLSDQAQLTGIDDGNSQKSINIITKAGIQNAQFGRVFAGAGNDNRYSAGGNLSFFKNDRRISVVGNFNNINVQNFSSQDLLGVTGSSNSRSGYPSMSGGRYPGGPGGSSESFTINQTSGINTTNALGINYGDKWGKSTTITGSYFFNNSENDNNSETNNKLIEQGLTTYQQSFAQSSNFNHRINARAEIKLDSSNMLFIIPNISFQSNNADKTLSLKSYASNNDSLFNALSGSNSDKKGYNIKNNFLFRHSFKKKSRVFTAGLNTTFTKNDALSDINGLYRFYDYLGFPVFPDSVQQQNSDNNTHGYTIGGSLTYNEPLDKKGKSQLQFEYNPSIQKSFADQQTFSYDGVQYSKFDTLLSNKFENTIETQNGGITYRYNASKDEQLSFGFNYQYTSLYSDRSFPVIAQVNQPFSNLLPNASWRKKISKYSNIRTFYRASTNFPSISQLQDVLNLSSATNVSIGNKDLKQSYTQYLGGRYSYTNTKTNRSFFTGAFIQLSDDYITNATFVAASDSALQPHVILRKGTQLTKPVNLNGYQLLRTFVTYSIPVKKLKTIITMNAVLLYNKLPGMVNYVKTNTNTLQYTLGAVFASNINEYVDYNVTYNANINRAETRGSVVTRNDYVNHSIAASLNLLSKKGWFVQNEVNAQVFRGLTGGFNQSYTLWNASLGKKLMKNKVGELKITVFDILKQNQSISRTITSLNVEDSRSQVLQQYFMLTFSYNLKNFGSPKKTENKEEFIPPVGYPNRY